MFENDSQGERAREKESLYIHVSSFPRLDNLSVCDDDERERVEGKDQLFEL